MSNPSSAYRTSYIYIQRRTRQRLHLLAGIDGVGKTADEVAETLLNEIIESKYPQVIEVEKQIAGIQNDLAALLREGKK